MKYLVVIFMCILTFFASCLSIPMWARITSIILVAVIGIVSNIISNQKEQLISFSLDAITLRLHQIDVTLKCITDEYPLSDASKKKIEDEVLRVSELLSGLASVVDDDEN